MSYETEKWYESRIEELELRNSRLRKAVNWLRGANHGSPLDQYEDSRGHWGTVDECDQWECQRARDVLAEDLDTEPPMGLAQFFHGYKRDEDKDD